MGQSLQESPQTPISRYLISIIFNALFADHRPDRLRPRIGIICLGANQYRLQLRSAGNENDIFPRSGQPATEITADAACAHYCDFQAIISLNIIFFFSSPFFDTCHHLQPFATFIEIEKEFCFFCILLFQSFSYASFTKYFLLLEVSLCSYLSGNKDPLPEGRPVQT